jgi:hypothetical protein
MSIHRVALRLVTLLFLLAALLLLRKPVFGQTAATLVTKPVNQTSVAATPIRSSSSSQSVLRHISQILR